MGKRFYSEGIKSLKKHLTFTHDRSILSIRYNISLNQQPTKEEIQMKRKCLYSVKSTQFSINYSVRTVVTTNVSAYSKEEAEAKVLKVLSNNNPEGYVTTSNQAEIVAKLVGTYCFSNAIGFEIYSVVDSGETEWVVAYEDKEFQYGEAVEVDDHLGLMFGNNFIPFSEVYSSTI